ncbi:MAG: DsbC family protein [Burkholderiales bacterium]|nr:DsbC family protein [Burkholderiales bacterium]
MKIKSIVSLLLVNTTLLFNNAFATNQTNVKNVTNSNIPPNAISNFNPVKVDSKEISEYFHKLLPTTAISSIYTTPYSDIYALIIGVNIVYGNLHSPYLMVGHLFNVYTQNDITAQLQKQTAPKIDISKINISDAVQSKAPSKVHKKLVIFSDPDCPYCRQLEQMIYQKEINKKADIYYMMMPLSIHQNAKTHATNILCSTAPLVTLHEYMVKNNENPTIKLIPDCNIDSTLERIGSTARSLSINATPVIITGDGEQIMGADMDAINAYLNK